MSETSTEHPNSTIVDDIIETFTQTARISSALRNMLVDGAGGNPVTCYRKFKKSFNYLYDLSSDHKEMANDETKKAFQKWRDTPANMLITSDEIFKGLKLFDTYKSELFGAQLLTHRG